MRDDTPVERVGWIGLGAIGAPMARRLLDHPGGLVVCDVAAEATAPFAEAGATVAADAAGVVDAGATVLSVMVRDDPQVRSVVEEILAADPIEGTLVAVHSTIHPGTAADLAEDARRAGLHLVDAPVSGGPVGAATGRLAVLLGAEADVVPRCRAAFAGFADKVVHFGPVGAGTRAKVARNLVSFAGFVAAGEALRLADASGLDLVGLGEVVRHSDAVTGGAGAIMLRDATGPLAPDDGLRPIFGHTLELGTKDLDLALAMAAEAGLDLPVAAAAREGLAAALGLEAPDAP